MLERTKTHPTDKDIVCVILPKADYLRFRKPTWVLVEGGKDESEDGLVRWEESSVFPRENAPGVFLAGARYREDMTQRELADRTGIPLRHISEMENGKRPVGEADAKKLAEALNVDYRMFL